MSRHDLRNTVRRSIVWTLVMGVLQVGLSLGSIVLLVRYLEPREYGVWAMLAALPTMINLGISFGYGEFILRFVPVVEDADAVGRIVWSIVARRILLALGASVLLVAGFDLYADSFDLRSYWPHLMAAQGAVIFNVGTIYLNHAMNARFMQRQIVLRTLPAQTVYLVLVAAGILAQKDLFYFVMVSSIVAVANFAFSGWAFALLYPPPRSIAKVPETSEQKRYRRLSYIDEWGINFLSTDIARYLVSYFSNNAEVAVYAISTTIVARLQFFLPFTMLRPLVSSTFYTRYEQTGDSDELRRMFRFLYDVNNLVSLFFVAVFATCGRDLLALVFRDEYADAYLPVMILLGFLALHLIPVGMVVKALKRPEVLIYSKVAVLLNVALGIPLVIHHGATGMALATMLSVTARNAIMLAFLRRAIDLRMPWRATMRAALAAMVTAVIGLQLAPYLPLVAELFLAGLLYVGFIRVLRPLHPADRLLVADMLPMGRAILPWVLGR